MSGGRTKHKSSKIPLEKNTDLKQMDLHNWQLQKMAKGLAQAKNREFATDEEVQSALNKWK
ncbi:MAG: hypothetical protein LBQ34_02860 [Alphaproteobacteria bacterium]|jgi:predicted transcriptional regulator|nr:hypothetical protein [Alphaproteobacteria bacterium]